MEGTDIFQLFKITLELEVHEHGEKAACSPAENHSIAGTGENLLKSFLPIIQLCRGRGVQF